MQHANVDHMISGDKSETVEIQKKTMDWKGELTELFSRSNTECIHQAIKGLWTKYNGKFNTSELFNELDQIIPTDAHWTFTSPAVMIGIELAIFIIGMLIWKKCSSKQETPTQTPSAPPMPMPDLNPRPIANPVPFNKATKSNTSIPISINIS
jgi:hypothetical protein